MEALNNSCPTNSKNLQIFFRFLLFMDSDSMGHFLMSENFNQFSECHLIYLDNFNCLIPWYIFILKISKKNQWHSENWLKFSDIWKCPIELLPINSKNLQKICKFLLFVGQLLFKASILFYLFNFFL